MARKNYPAKRGQNPHRGENIKKGKRQGQGRDQEYFSEVFGGPEDLIAVVPERKAVQPLRALNETQFNGITSIRQNAITFLTGPAGTGKSYIAAGVACEMLASKQIERIIISRPKICVDREEWGALPGTLQDKFSEYIEPFLDVMRERLGAGALKYMLSHGRICAKPLAFLRGYTFKSDTFVILDEGQNVSSAQYQCFLTRIGEDAKMVIAGDYDQSDLRCGGGLSGMEDAVKRLRGLPGVGVIEADENDIVRSGLARDIVLAYRKQI
jgi:phosphate starvation-inducible PhoH-like protein